MPRSKNLVVETYTHDRELMPKRLLDVLDHAYSRTTAMAESILVPFGTPATHFVHPVKQRNGLLLVVMLFDELFEVLIKARVFNVAIASLKIRFAVHFAVA